MQLYRQYGKRALDLMITLPMTVLLLPLIALVALAVHICLSAPVLFRQPRAGFQGQVFTLCKFRSMVDRRDASGEFLPDEQRLTRFGRTLRRLSLDELPQLWNVVRGEMSLVGPRPLLVEYLDRYTPQQERRHEVLPGITGWAQINGRNAVSWEEKFELDVWYVDRVSLWLDIRILWGTLLKMFARDDVSAAGHATMPKFQGTQAP